MSCNSNSIRLARGVIVHHSTNNLWFQVLERLLNQNDIGQGRHVIVITCRRRFIITVCKPGHVGRGRIIRSRLMAMVTVVTLLHRNYFVFRSQHDTRMLLFWTRNSRAKISVIGLSTEEVSGAAVFSIWLANSGIVPVEEVSPLFNFGNAGASDSSDFLGQIFGFFRVTFSVFLVQIFGFSPCTFRAVYFRVEPRTLTSAQKCDAEHDVKYTRP